MKLFEPFTINKITLKNRIIMPGMDTNFGDEDGNILDKLIDYYKLRAQGGVGLIIVEGAFFDKIGAGTATMLSIDSNKRIKRFKELVDTIKEYGSHVMIQIYHAGAQASSYMIGLQAVAPSAIPFEMSGETPQPLTKKQISKIVKGYGEACLRAKKAGFDGVEIHAGHGYLLNQFFSLRTNKRDDEYGGKSFENRTRAAVEIIREVRNKCGNDFIIGFRINGSDYIKDGLEVEDVIQITKILEKEGIDLINVTGGVFDSPGFPVVPYMSYPKGCFSHNAQQIKQALEKTPVAVVGRINVATVAEEILQDGKADLVTVGRALIADPEFPNKIKAGEEQSIRTCIGCNACLNQIMTEQPVKCSINPNLIGSDKDIEIAKEKRKILIIGAGPAGLEFSRIAKIRGHDVHIIDKNPFIGGSLNYAGKTPMKKEVLNLIDFYNYTLDKLGIDVQLETPFSTDILAKYNPDVVVIATGIEPKIPDIKGIKETKFHLYSDILGGEIPKGQKVVILGGDMIGIETAEYMSCANKEVTIITQNKRLGMDLYSLVAREVVSSVEEDDKIEIMLETEIKEIKNNELIISQNGKTSTIKYDDFVIAIAHASIEVENLVKGKFDKIFKIGDCKEIQPRKILDSIEEGYELAKIIETPEADLLFSDEFELKAGDLKSLMKIKIKKRSFTIDDIPNYLDLLTQVCNENEKIQKKNKKAKLLFQISISDEKFYYIKIENGFFTAGEGKVENSNVRIWIDKSSASGIFMGTINAASAYMAKEIKFEGSMMLGLKFRSFTDAVVNELEQM